MTGYLTQDWEQVGRYYSYMFEIFDLFDWKCMCRPMLLCFFHNVLKTIGKCRQFFDKCMINLYYMTCKCIHTHAVHYVETQNQYICIGCKPQILVVYDLLLSKCCCNVFEIRG